VAAADRLGGWLDTRDGGPPPFQPFLHKTRRRLVFSTRSDKSEHHMSDMLQLGLAANFVHCSSSLVASDILIRLLLQTTVLQSAPQRRHLPTNTMLQR
jgi:hypothetical protein